LKEPIDAEWKAHQLDPNPNIKEDQYLAFSNRRVREMLSQESEDVKAEVENERQAALRKDNAPTNLLWPDAETISKEELERRNNLVQKQK
jgi:hypothetical protein